MTIVMPRQLASLDDRMTAAGRRLDETEPVLRVLSAYRTTHDFEGIGFVGLAGRVGYDALESAERLGVVRRLISERWGPQALWELTGPGYQMFLVGAE